MHTDGTSSKRNSLNAASMAQLLKSSSSQRSLHTASSRPTSASTRPTSATPLISGSFPLTTSSRLTRTVTHVSSPLIMTGLSRGHSYSIALYATNQYGDSPWVASKKVITLPLIDDVKLDKPLYEQIPLTTDNDEYQTISTLFQHSLYRDIHKFGKLTFQIQQLSRINNTTVKTAFEQHKVTNHCLYSRVECVVCCLIAFIILLLSLLLYFIHFSFVLDMCCLLLLYHDIM